MRLQRKAFGNPAGIARPAFAISRGSPVGFAAPSFERVCPCRALEARGPILPCDVRRILPGAAQFATPDVSQ